MHFMAGNVVAQLMIQLLNSLLLLYVLGNLSWLPGHIAVHNKLVSNFCSRALDLNTFGQDVLVVFLSHSNKENLLHSYHSSVRN